MQRNIRSHGFSLTKALADRVRRSFVSAMRHGGRLIAAVTVRLRDVIGAARGGVDERCGVELRFAHGGSIVIHETDSSLYTAIDRAAGRSEQALSRRLEQAGSRRRRAARRSVRWRRD